MKIYLLLPLLFLSFCRFGSSTLSKCAAGVTCPAGGIWSEWSTTETCQTSCGSCSKVFYTRKCLTTEIAGCECTGDNSRYYLCNTDACAYPAQRTCCIPYVAMVINRTSTCGPLPNEATVTSCCPVDGVWSEWSTFSRNSEDTLFERFRKCLTAEAGCPCTGSPSDGQEKCPCRSFAGKSEIETTLSTPRSGTITQRLVSPLVAWLSQSTCIYEAQLNKNTSVCNHWKNYTSTAVIRYILPSNVNDYEEQRVADCTDPGKSYVRMYCDFETLNYRYYKTNKEVYGWSQINYN